MKFPCLPALALLAAALLAPAALRADPIEFNGVIVGTDATKVALLNSATGESRWVAIGHKFGNYTVTSFSATNSAVVLTDTSGAAHTLHLRTATLVSAPSPDVPATSDAPILAELAAPTPNAASTTHVVSPGDTLALIANKNGVKVKELVEANHISDPSKLKVGQKLIIPGEKLPAN